MKNILLAATLIWVMSSCSKQPIGDWVHFSSYNEYVILNNGDTVTYSDGFVMSGMTSGATKRQLTSEEQQMLLDHLDTICRTTVDPNTPFVDKGVKWRNMDSITGVKRTLDYWMKFQGHTINDKYKNLTADDVKMIVCNYDSTYQKYINDGDKRLYYEMEGW
jgi:hypothetical protein